ncbi:MAG TPA: FecR domain-containing protein, partial [Thermodesulfovibrionales bacterium]|nr:FecR domain-containing protein [Thermodesulfovibrionales bacterium]
DESGVEISFEEGDSFLMRSNTTLAIRVARKGVLNLLQRLYLGTGRTISRIREATGRNSRFEVQTPSAVAVARGTTFRVAVDEEETTRSEVLKGLIDVESMARRVEVREGEGTITRKSEPPMKPRKLLPPPALLQREPIYKAMPLTFSFSGIEGASFYRIMVTRDSAGKDVLKERVIKPVERAEIGGVDDGEYYLISQSIDADGLEGVPADPVAFMVRTNPLPPFIRSPVEGATPRDRRVQFRWLKVKDAVSYHLQIADDKEFVRIVMDKDNVTATEFISPLLEFKPYFFRVSSVADDGYEGIPSDIQSFTIVPPPPAPEVEKPETEGNMIRLRWRNLGEEITYRFQMSTDNEFRNILMDRKVEMPEITFQRPEETGIYYVRTSGIDREGYEGDFSLPQSFEVKKRFPVIILGILGAVGLIILLL